MMLNARKINGPIDTCNDLRNAVLFVLHFQDNIYSYLLS